MINTTVFRVCCDECGTVAFAELGQNRFGDERDANYYAGVHDGVEHLETPYRMAFVEEAMSDG